MLQILMELPPTEPTDLDKLITLLPSFVIPLVTVIVTLLVAKVNKGKSDEQALVDRLNLQIDRAEEKLNSLDEKLSDVKKKNIAYELYTFELRKNLLDKGIVPPNYPKDLL